MELDFVFKIHTVSLHEEFVVCASATECQAIQLNFASNVCTENSSEEKELTGSSSGHDVIAGRRPSPTRCQCRFCVYANRSNDVNPSNSSGKRNGTTMDQVVGISCGVGCSTNDEDLANSHSSFGQSRSSPLTHQAKLRQQFTCCDLGLSETTNECEELFAGPVKGSEAPCPVSVEFKGIMSTCVFLNYVFLAHIYMFTICHAFLELILKMQVFCCAPSC